MLGDRLNLFKNAYSTPSRCNPSLRFTLNLMSYYLDIEVKQTEKSIFIFQQIHVKEIFKKFTMNRCNPLNIPIECGAKLSRHKEGEKMDPHNIKA